jgi:hypothetical protein
MQWCILSSCAGWHNTALILRWIMHDIPPAAHQTHNILPGDSVTSLHESYVHAGAQQAAAEGITPAGKMPADTTLTGQLL